MKYLYTFLIIGLFSFSANAQSGPNDIGDENKFYFKASYQTQTGNHGSNPNLVEKWGDLTVNNNNAYQNGVGRRPEINNTAINNLPGIVFDGQNDQLKIDNTTDINTMSFLEDRSISMLFKTSDEISRTQILYEEGGASRGLNLFINNGSIFVSAWNFPEGNWGYYSIGAPIEENSIYIVSMVFDVDNDRMDFYLNSKAIGSVSDIGRLHNHPDGIGIGNVNGSTIVNNNVISGNHTLKGSIGIITLFNYSLDKTELSDLENLFADDYGLSGLLPIELESFEANPDDKANILEWVTASEINNDYFTIERSENGLEWEVIGNIEGAGNSNTRLSYEYYDMELQSSAYYYRLTQTDFDGKSETFDPVFVRNELSAPLRIENIVSESGNVQVNFEAISGEPVIIEVFDLSGKYLRQISTMPREGINIERFTVNSRSGIHVLRLKQGNKAASQKLYIQ